MLQLSLQDNKWSLLDNLLMSFMQESFFGNIKRAKKYYNVALKKYQSLQSIRIDIHKIDSDLLWRELINFLI